MDSNEEAHTWTNRVHFVINIPNEFLDFVNVNAHPIWNSMCVTFMHSNFVCFIRLTFASLHSKTTFILYQIGNGYSENAENLLKAWVEWMGNIAIVLTKHKLHDRWSNIHTHKTIQWCANIILYKNKTSFAPQRNHLRNLDVIMEGNWPNPLRYELNSHAKRDE